MFEAKKHLKNITPYPIDKEFDWDLKLDFNENLIGPSKKVIRAIKNINPEKIKFYPFYEKLIEAIAAYNKVNTENVLPVNAPLLIAVTGHPPSLNGISRTLDEPE